VNVAVIQTSSLPYDKAKVNYYLSILKTKNVKIVLFGEYVLNLFFTELQKAPLPFIKEQSARQIELFKKLAKIYGMTLIAPIVVVQKDKIYKSIAKFSPKSTKFYYQQVLMPYSHWNEKNFFKTKLSKPIIFRQEGFVVGVLFGFETHFDEFWQYFRNKKVDLVLVPSVGTFGSAQRWRKLLCTQAFLNNCYILRANRVGKSGDWVFYGDSFLVNPNGDMVEVLGNKEELLVATLEKKEVKEAKKEWGFLNLRKDLMGVLGKNQEKGQ
jgi:nitrilase